MWTWEVMIVSSESEITVTKPKASTLVLEALEQCDDFDVHARGVTLYDFVDVDALNSLFDHSRNANLSVEFDIQDLTVSVWQSDGEVRARVDN